MKAAVLDANQRIDARRSSRIEFKSSLTWNRLWGAGLFVALAGLLALSAWKAPDHLTFKDFGVAEVGKLFTTLFVVALLAERALEIFIGTWRNPRAMELELEVETCGKRLAEPQTQGDRAALGETRTRLEEAKRELLKYRCATRQIALRVGLVLGFLVSGVGVHALDALVTLSGSDSAHGTAFHLVDGLLTGGVIAGGSEGIHRLATVFDNFMTSTAKRAKASA
jgi:hypothetical protein